jgi:signal transduction histidine kinase
MKRTLRLIRGQDVVWLGLFSALAAVSPGATAEEIVLLLCLGVFQVLEPKVSYLRTGAGVVLAILIKLLLCYLLIGLTGGINSTYYLILLVPVVSAATTLRLLPTVLVTALACCTYLSFLILLDWSRYELAPEAYHELGLRLLILVVVAFLTHQLAEANRREALRYQRAAAQLEEMNQTLREAEAAVRRSDRLAALGQMTAGLAHELRNPLGTIRASAEMLTKSVATGNEITRELAGFIAAEVDRTNSLITRFLEFARPVRLRRSLTDLTAVVDRAIQQFERHHPPFDISIYRNYDPGVPPIELDGELMERVIYNLLLNAAQATPASGAVTVKLRCAGDGVEISVIDRGSGIKSEDLENVFNPFFTTKQDGVGLGLAIVSKIVDEHGGHIAVSSEAGAGSVFRVLLPLRDGGNTPAGATAAASLTE